MRRNAYQLNIARAMRAARRRDIDRHLAERTLLRRRSGRRGAGRMNALLIRQATKPMMTKLTSALPKSPILNGIGPGVTAVCHDFGSGVATATIGMMKSSTTAVTSLFSAPPTTTAIASARTFSFSEKRLELSPHGHGAPREVGESGALGAVARSRVAAPSP